MGNAEDFLNNEDKPILNDQLKGIYEEGRERTTQNLANSLGLQYIDLRKVNIEIPALSLIDKEVANAANILAYQINGKQLAVALLDFNNSKTQEVLAGLKDKEYELQIFVCSSTSFV